MLYPGKPGLFLQNIQCYPPPRFIWYKRGKPLDLSSDRYSVSPSGSLGIRRIRSTDMGVYTLKLQMGSAMKETGVKVAAAVDGVDFTEWQGQYHYIISCQSVRLVWDLVMLFIVAILDICRSVSKATQGFLDPGTIHTIYRPLFINQFHVHDFFCQ